MGTYNSSHFFILLKGDMMLYEIYKMLRLAETKVKGDARISIFTKMESLVLTAVWKDGLAFRIEFSVQDVFSSKNNLEDLLDFFIGRCNEEYKKVKEKVLKGDKNE